MRQKTWAYSPPKPKVPDAVKAELKAEATEVIEKSPTLLSKLKESLSKYFNVLILK